MSLLRGLADDMGCNRAVLVSVGQFDPGVTLGRRPGVSKDEKRLHRTLTKLGFKVDIHTDLSSKEIYQLFETESHRPVKECFLAVLSTHGEEGLIFGSDGRPVILSHIFSFFDNPTMEKKTKLFFIQACRGDGLDDGVEVDSGPSEDSLSLSPSLCVPIDTAVMYATAPGYGAFMHPLGSVFLQTLCNLLEEGDNQNLELSRLMTRLNHRVAYTFQAKGRLLGGKKEMPCLVSRLTREVYPFAQQGKDSSIIKLSTTAMISPVSARKRMPSIS